MSPGAGAGESAAGGSKGVGGTGGGASGGSGGNVGAATGAGGTTGAGAAAGAGAGAGAGAAGSGASGKAGATAKGGAGGMTGGAGAAGAGATAGKGGAGAATTRAIALKTKVTGNYVTVAKGAVTAAASAVGALEILTLTDLGGGALLDGDFVTLAAADGALVSAVNGGGGALVTNKVVAGPFETFAIKRLAGAGTITDGDAIAFESSSMVEYVTALNGGGGEVRCDEPHALDWETFQVTLDAKPAPPPANAAAKVIAFLSSLGGAKTLTGQHDKYNATPSSATDQVKGITGAYPALWSADFGFGQDALDHRGTMIAEAKKQWLAGAVVQLMYHNCAPTRDELCGWDEIGGANPAHLSDAEWSDLVTPGTALHAAWLGRLDTLSPYFADLKAAGVAPLFRPLHEMNQGAFWWGGRGGPDGTRKLFQITHDYLVKTKGFDHIVWVWDVQDFDSLAADVVAYHPGASYFDVAALDIYGGGYTTDKYVAIEKAAGGKPFAIGECEHPPTPAILDSQPGWSFFMLWPDFVDENAAVLPGLYAAPRMITRDEMPGW